MYSRIARWLICASAVALCFPWSWPRAACAMEQGADPTTTSAVAGDPGQYPDLVGEAEVAPPLSPQGAQSVGYAKPINYQGFVTDALGAPLQGPHNFTVYLYDAAAAGTVQFGREDHTAVNVVNGHFLLAIGAGTLGAPNLALDPAVFDVDLWLEVWVDGSPLPRQPLRAVPWSYGLIPGATVWGDPTDSYALRVIHTGTGATDRGIYAYGNQYGLVADEFGTGSDAIYSGNYVNAQGYRSRSDSYLWFPGMECEPIDPVQASATVSGFPRGAVKLKWTGTGGHHHGFHLPLTLPGELLGQRVTVEQITVYYMSSSAANANIDDTSLSRMTDANSEVLVVSDLTDHASTVATSYALTPTSDNVLSSASGPLTLYFICYFANTIDYVQLGMVRVRLGHTETP
jgi:hypothetical protein